MSLGPICSEPNCGHLASTAGQGKWCTRHGLPKLDDAALAGVLSQYAADLADEGRGAAPQVMLEAALRLRRAAEAVQSARADQGVTPEVGDSPWLSPRELLTSLEHAPTPANQAGTTWSRLMMQLLWALVREVERTQKLEPTLRLVIERNGFNQP